MVKEKVYCKDCKYYKIGTCYDECLKIIGYKDTPIEKEGIQGTTYGLNNKNNCKHYLEKVNKPEDIHEADFPYLGISVIIVIILVVISFILNNCGCL